MAYTDETREKKNHEHDQDRKNQYVDSSAETEVGHLATVKVEFYDVYERPPAGTWSPVGSGYTFTQAHRAAESQQAKHRDFGVAITPADMQV